MMINVAIWSGGGQEQYDSFINQILSPFINLIISPDDYIKLLSNFSFYMSQ